MIPEDLERKLLVDRVFERAASLAASRGKPDPRRRLAAAVAQRAAFEVPPELLLAFAELSPSPVDDAHRVARGRAAIELALGHVRAVLEVAARRSAFEAENVSRLGNLAREALERGLEQFDATERGSLEEAERVMQACAREVENRLPAGWRFLVLACTAEAPGFTSYVSNVHREDACALLTEWLAKIQLRRPEA